MKALLEVDVPAKLLSTLADSPCRDLLPPRIASMYAAKLSVAVTREIIRRWTSKSLGALMQEMESKLFDGAQRHLARWMQ